MDMNIKYVSTSDVKDVVDLPAILNRWLQIHDGDITGFEDYVKSGFLDDAGYADYITYGKEIIYDKMCNILTNYEDFVNGKGNDSEIYEHAADMYQLLVEIQSRWEDVITVQE